MRFHLVSLPFTQTTEDFPSCAFTMKVRKFAKMMHNAGHTVFLYSGEYNTTPCYEHIQCITEEERAASVSENYTIASFDSTLPHWQKFNLNAINEIKKRMQPKDFICLIGGTSQKIIADSIPELMAVEFGIGYPGTFSKYRVFESYTWMHTIYGTSTNNAGMLDGVFFDDVINGYVDEDEFLLGEGKGDKNGEYYMFIGRLIERKGFQIAADVCEHLGARLIVAGIGEPPSYGEYVGSIGSEKIELFQNAKAIFVPTTYIEPYGTVVPEAMMCGTPAITTDFGAFSETVINGVNGYRCHTFGEFVEAAKIVPELDRKAIRELAVERFSLKNTASKYEKYFHRLMKLWDDGWYTTDGSTLKKNQFD